MEEKKFVIEGEIIDCSPLFGFTRKDNTKGDKCILTIRAEKQSCPFDEICITLTGEKARFWARRRSDDIDEPNFPIGKRVRAVFKNKAVKARRYKAPDGQVFPCCINVVYAIDVCSIS